MELMEPTHRSRANVCANWSPARFVRAGTHMSRAACAGRRRVPAVRGAAPRAARTRSKISAKWLQRLTRRAAGSWAGRRFRLVCSVIRSQGLGRIPVRLAISCSVMAWWAAARTASITFTRSVLRLTYLTAHHQARLRFHHHRHSGHLPSRLVCRHSFHRPYCLRLHRSRRRYRPYLRFLRRRRHRRRPRLGIHLLDNHLLFLLLGSLRCLIYHLLRRPQNRLHRHHHRRAFRPKRPHSTALSPRGRTQTTPEASAPTLSTRRHAPATMWYRAKGI